METEKLYYADPFLTEFDARVLACEAEKGGYAVVLDRTAFYPEGGGQPYDTGVLGGVEVSEVHEKAGVVTPLPCPWARRCMGSSTGRGASTTCSSTPASTSARG